MKSLIPLAKARRYADQIAALLQPFCARLEIAGSIRRERPFCGDIDLVAEPKDEPALRARILEGKYVIQNGPQNIYVRLQLPRANSSLSTPHSELEINVFLARPETRDMFDTKPSNFGSLLLCRTGSKEHNIFLAQTARANCCEWKISEGLFRDGKWIAGTTEEEIFDALHLNYVPPKNREIAASYHHVPTASTFTSGKSV